MSKLGASSCLFAVAALAGIVATQARGEQGPVCLWDLLHAQAGSVRTFRADVRVTHSLGSDLGRLADDMVPYLHWLETQKPGQSQDAFRRAIAAMHALRPKPAASYRYFSEAPDRARFETYGGTDGAPAVSGTRLESIQVFSGDRWERDGTPANPQNPLIIERRASNELPLLEIARGAAAYSWYLVDCSDHAQALHQVSWDELLMLLDRATAVERQSPMPGGGPAKPMLEVSSKRDDRPTSKGLRLYRLRIWFDPNHSYLPVRMECQQISLTGAPIYIPSLVAEWPTFATTRNGTEYPTECVERFYQTFMPVVPGKPRADWTNRAYEGQVDRIRLTNVRLNEPLDPGLFQIKPARGTTVVDEVSGFKYTVGSAGQQLRKTALDLAAQNGPPGGPHWTTWLFAALAFLGVGAVGGWLYLRWRAGLRST